MDQANYAVYIAGQPLELTFKEYELLRFLATHRGRVFTREATPPLSSIKSMLGHAMGAASAIEAAVCALAVATDRIPPTINLEDPDPECDLDFVPGAARAHRVTVALNNAYAFGGLNTSVVFRKVGS